MSLISVEDAIDSVIDTIKSTFVKECPRCHLFVQGESHIERFFGWKKCDGSVIPQNFCRKCRSKKYNCHETHLFEYEQLTFHTIKQARKLKKNINVEGIISKKDFVQNIDLNNGETVKLCPAILTDQFNDEIEVFLWGHDVNRVKNYSKITMIDCFIHNYRGKIALSIGKLGRVEVINEYKRKPSIHKTHADESLQTLSNDNWIVDKEDTTLSYLKTNLDDSKFNDLKF